MSFEGEEDLDVQLGDIVPCDCSEGSYGHINALVERDWPPRFSLGNAHFWRLQASGNWEMDCGRW